MTYVMEPYDALPCCLRVFTINGKDADKDDFGDTWDREHYRAEPYACACMTFERDPKLKDSAMAKYQLSEEEYKVICDALEETLYVGHCGWCV